MVVETVGFNPGLPMGTKLPVEEQKIYMSFGKESDKCAK
jgi:hypothetical protein